MTLLEDSGKRVRGCFKMLTLYSLGRVVNSFFAMFTVIVAVRKIKNCFGVFALLVTGDLHKVLRPNINEEQ